MKSINKINKKKYYIIFLTVVGIVSLVILGIGVFVIKKKIIEK